MLSSESSEGEKAVPGKLSTVCVSSISLPAGHFSRRLSHKVPCPLAFHYGKVRCVRRHGGVESGPTTLCICHILLLEFPSTLQNSEG